MCVLKILGDDHRQEDVTMKKVKFTKVFLTNVLGMEQEQVKMVMKYQRLFPSLLTDQEGFCVDGRTFWKELGKPQGDFSNWINRKVVKKQFEENIDYSSFHKTVEREKGATVAKEYTLTIDCAKNVAMMENTKYGMKVRKYFILMEKALKGMQEHLIIRHPEKAGYKEMCKQLDVQYCKEHEEATSAPNYIYSNNANMINRALLGKTAKEIKVSLDMADNHTRENLSIEVNKALYELQVLNTSLIIADMDYKQRKSIVEQSCKVKYNNLVEEVRHKFEQAA